MKYICRCCGAEHDGLPALTLMKPDYWLQLTDEERAGGKCDDDLCATHDGHYFIRCVLIVPTIDGPESTLEYGVWSSLSEESFWAYVKTYDDGDQSKIGGFFGWLSNEIRGFPGSLNLRCNVLPQDHRKRPIIELQPSEHALFRAQRSGLSWERALELAHEHLGDRW